MTLRASALLCLVGIVVAARSSLADTVHRRGAAKPLIGNITSIENAGVRIDTDDDAELLVSWDRVRRIDTNRSFPGLEQRLDMATSLWRARTRIERGDTTLAEPLLDRLFAQVRGQTHETALVVAEGLLRCRLDRGAQEAALIPMLEVARLKRAGITSVSYSTLSPVVDEPTLLSTKLAPVWIGSPALASVHRELESYDAGGDPVVAALAKLYGRSIGRALGRDVGEAPQRGVEHPGVKLLASLLRCESADADVRRDAAAQLEGRIAELPEWARAWARYQLGVSMLRDPDVQTRQRGLVQLAHVPARYGAQQAYLSGMALDRMADELRRQGDADGAAAVLAELSRRYPDHPLLLTQLSVNNPI